MIHFQYHAPTQVIFGQDSYLQAPRLIQEAGASRILVHYGRRSVIRSGLLSQMLSALQDAGIPYETLGGVRPNPRLSLVHEGISLIKEKQIDFILAIGGGSVIDSAKAIAYGACNEGEIWDYYMKRKQVKGALPVGCIATAAAAGSEMSNSSVITREEDLCKRGRNTPLNFPKFSILNPEFTYTLPPFQTACGVVDIMAHMMERYFTRVTHVELIDRMTEGALKTVVGNAPIVMHEPENYDARAEIMWAGCLAHNTLFQTGRVGDWASHKLEHELSALYDIAHGAGLAIVFPAWMKYALAHGGEAKLAQFAVRVFDVPVSGDDAADAAEGIRRLEAFYRSLGLTTTLTENGIGDTDFGRMAERAVALAGGTLGQFVPLKAADCEAIYRLAL